MKHIFSFNIIFTTILLLSVVGNAKPVSEQDKELMKGSTVSIIENRGQLCDQNEHLRPDILYYGSAGSLNYYLKKNGISYQLVQCDTTQQHKTFDKFSNLGKDIPTTTAATIYRVDINWLGANQKVNISTDEPNEGYRNYYLAHCHEGVTNVRNYNSILYSNLYDGIDLKYYYNKVNELEYDFIVHPHADYKKIRFEINGANSITYNNNGGIDIVTPLGTITEGAPIVTQDGKHIVANWVINDNTISYRIGSYDPSKPLVIDPITRIWGTYFGGGNHDAGLAGFSDGNGNIFIGGFTYSYVGIATTGAYQTTFAGGIGVGLYYDALLAKFNTNGNLLWATYYGGNGGDAIQGGCTDTSRNIYVTGRTSSTTGITTTGAHQTVYGGDPYDAFLAKFTDSGMLQWGTYWGGNQGDEGISAVVDNNNNVYVAGMSYSPNGISTPSAYQPVLNQEDGILAKFTPSGTLVWATYYGGSGDEYAKSCAFDNTGYIYIAGMTNSTTGIGTSGAHQTIYGGAPTGAGVNGDAYLAKFNVDGVLVWSTYYGGSGEEYGISCSVDNYDSSVYLEGWTTSTNNIASTGAHQTNLNGATDMYLVKFTSLGTRLWGTYYGGNDADRPSNMAIDAVGNIYISGNSYSATNFTTANAYQPTFNGVITPLSPQPDATLGKFSPNGNLIWSTYYGGNKGDFGNFCICHSGEVYFGGTTYSVNNIASVGACQINLNGNGSATSSNGDAFLVKFCDSVELRNITTSNTHVCIGNSITLNNSSSNGIWSSTNNSIAIINSTGIVTGISTGLDTISYTITNICGTATQKLAIQVDNNIPVLSNINGPDSACVGSIVSLISNTPGGIWNSGNPLLATINGSGLLTPLMAGVDTVSYSVTNGCGTTTQQKVVTIYNCSTTNIGLNAIESMQIYPNPANNILHVDNLTTSVDYQLQNMVGVTVQQGTFTQEHNTLQLKEIPAGIYLLQLTDAIGQREVVRVVKQ